MSPVGGTKGEVCHLQLHLVFFCVTCALGSLEVAGPFIEPPEPSVARQWRNRGICPFVKFRKKPSNLNIVSHNYVIHNSRSVDRHE